MGRRIKHMLVSDADFLRKHRESVKKQKESACLEAYITSKAAAAGL